MLDREDHLHLFEFLGLVAGLLGVAVVFAPLNLVSTDAGLARGIYLAFFVGYMFASAVAYLMALSGDIQSQFAVVMFRTVIIYFSFILGFGEGIALLQFVPIAASNGLSLVFGVAIVGGLVFGFTLNTAYGIARETG